MEFDKLARKLKVIKQKQLKAGVLLYTMVVAVIFGLFLQFYIDNQVRIAKQLNLQKQNMVAQLMVEMVKKDKLADSGTVKFDKGICNYKKVGTNINYEIQLNSGQKFNLLERQP